MVCARDLTKQKPQESTSIRILFRKEPSRTPGVMSKLDLCVKDPEQSS